MKTSSPSAQQRMAFAGLLLLLPFTAFSQALNLRFINNSGFADTNVWVNWQNGGGSWSVSYDGKALVAPTNGRMGASLTLAEIGAAGFYVTNVNSAGIYVSFGAPIPVGAAPNPQSVGDPSYTTRYQNFELTRLGNAGDQGDLTAINFFTSTMSARTYHGGTTGTLLQSAGYHVASSTLASQLAALTANDPAAVVYDAGSNFVRVIAPTSFGLNNFGPYPSFTNYLHDVHRAGQMTIVSNFNAFNNGPNGGAGAGTTNFNFTLRFLASVTSNNSIQMSGEISTVITPFSGGSFQGPTFSNVVTYIPGSNANEVSYVIYGSVASAGTTFTGGWTNFQAYARAHNLWQTNAAGEVTFDAFATTRALAIGEITTGFLAGMVNSTNLFPGTTEMIKDVPSKLWWDASNPVAFADVQVNSDFYNQYAGLIYASSSNSVYGMPYSDRFVHSPTLLNTVSYNSTSVDTMVVTLESLFSVGGPAIPEPDTGRCLLAGLIGMALVISPRALRRSVLNASA